MPRPTLTTTTQAMTARKPARPSERLGASTASKRTGDSNPSGLGGPYPAHREKRVPWEQSNGNPSTPVKHGAKFLRKKAGFER